MGVWMSPHRRCTRLPLPGGVVVAQAVGVAADTVRRGRAELDDPVVPLVEASPHPSHKFTRSG